MKVILRYDLEEKEPVAFVWDEPGEPPPLIKPKIKKRPKSREEEEKEEKN